jgi:hypothetical protein
MVNLINESRLTRVNLICRFLFIPLLRPFFFFGHFIVAHLRFRNYFNWLWGTRGAITHLTCLPPFWQEKKLIFPSWFFFSFRFKFKFTAINSFLLSLVFFLWISIFSVVWLNERFVIYIYIYIYIYKTEQVHDSGLVRPDRFDLIYIYLNVFLKNY